MKVFVHGNPETPAIWGPLLDALAQQGIDDTVAVTPPGFGAPTPADFDATAGGYAAWLTETVADFDGPIDLVGHDWGAGHVMAVVAAGVSIRSWACDVAGLWHPDYVWHDMAQVWMTPGAGEEAVAAMAAAPISDKTDMFAEALGMPTTIAAEVAAWVNHDMGACVLSLYRSADDAYRAELLAKLEAVDRPRGLVINATDDAYVSPALSQQVGERLGAEVVALEGQGHWWMMSAPQQAAGVLAQFWSGLD